MPNQLSKIKGLLSDCQGCMVRLYAIGERNKLVDTFGILEGVYPEIFVVQVEQGGYCRKYCYSYNEILTKRVKISPAIPCGQSIGWR